MSPEEKAQIVDQPVAARVKIGLPQFKLTHDDSIKLSEVQGARFTAFAIIDPPELMAAAALYRWAISLVF